MYRSRPLEGRCVDSLALLRSGSRRTAEKGREPPCHCAHAILRYHVAPPMPWHTNYVAILRMRGMGKVPANISVRKLTFLQRTAHGENDPMSTQLLRTIAATGIQQLDLVQHCPMHIQLEPLAWDFLYLPNLSKPKIRHNTLNSQGRYEITYLRKIETSLEESVTPSYTHNKLIN